jgi:hypothetical protein
MFFKPEDSTQIYFLGLKLRKAATALNMTSHGKSLNSIDWDYLKGDFEYIRNLIAEMDFEAKHYKKERHPELGDMVRQLYPLFYQTLIETRTDSEIGFSEKIYRLLTAGDGKSNLSLEDISKIEEVMLFMSEKCCDQFCDENREFIE